MIDFHPLRSRWAYWAIGAGLPLALAAACLGLVMAGAAWQMAARPRARPAAPMVRWCLSVRVTGSLHLATWWSAAISTRTGLVRQPFRQSNLICGLAPWQAWLPASGSFASSN